MDMRDTLTPVYWCILICHPERSEGSCWGRLEPRPAKIPRRHVDGIGGYMAAVRPALQDSPFSVNGGPPGGNAPVALVAVLGELGEYGLPDPRGSALWPNSPRNAEGR
jgi:hypothetical protein